MTLGALGGSLLSGKRMVVKDVVVWRMIIGTFHSGSVGDYFGRKYSLIGISLPYIAGWLLIR